MRGGAAQSSPENLLCLSVTPITRAAVIPRAAYAAWCQPPRELEAAHGADPPDQRGSEACWNPSAYMQFSACAQRLRWFELAVPYRFKVNLERILPIFVAEPASLHRIAGR